jgi:hypothetical protein
MRIITYHQERVVVERVGGKGKIAETTSHCGCRQSIRSGIWTALVLILFSLLCFPAVANDASSAGAVTLLVQLASQPVFYTHTYMCINACACV